MYSMYSMYVYTYVSMQIYMYVCTVCISLAGYRITDKMVRLVIRLLMCSSGRYILLDVTVR
jgi:hypothetical protein